MIPAIVYLRRRVVLPVVEREAVDVDLVGHRVGAHRRLAAALHRGRRGDDLGRASRLEHVLHRNVAGRGHADRIGGVERRVLREREDLPGVRVHDHDRAVLRVCRLDLRGAGLLGFELDVGVDGQLQAAGCHRGAEGLLGAGDRLLRRAELDLLAAVPPGQKGVVLLLEPGLAAQVARGVGVGEADEVRGEIAVRVGAGVAGILGDARQVQRVHQRGDPGAGTGWHVLFEHDILRRAWVIDQPEDGRLGHAKGTGQRRGYLRALGLGYLGRVGVDQVGLHGQREHRAVAAGDGATYDGDRDRLRWQHLLLRGRPVLRPVQALQLHQPGRDEDQREPDAHQREAQATAMPSPAQAGAAGDGRGAGGLRRAGRPAKVRRLSARPAPPVRGQHCRAPRGRAIASLLPDAHRASAARNPHAAAFGQPSACGRPASGGPGRRRSSRGISGYGVRSLSL